MDFVYVSNSKLNNQPDICVCVFLRYIHVFQIYIYIYVFMCVLYFICMYVFSYVCVCVKNNTREVCMFGGNQTMGADNQLSSNSNLKS